MHCYTLGRVNTELFNNVTIGAKLVELSNEVARADGTMLVLSAPSTTP